MSLISFFDAPIVYAPAWPARQSQSQSARRHAAARAYRALADHQAQLLSAFSDAFDSLSAQAPRVPRTELREVANGYVLLAELPGVRKEDLEVEIGEGGKTVRIEGRAGGRAKAPATAETPAAQEESAEATQPAKPAAEPTTAEATNTDVAAAPTPASEVAPPTQAEYTSTFSQTFTLPRPVDGGRVVARLEDGVLTLVVPFLEDRESVRVTVD